MSNANLPKCHSSWICKNSQILSGTVLILTEWNKFTLTTTDTTKHRKNSSPTVFCDYHDNNQKFWGLSGFCFAVPTSWNSFPDHPDHITGNHLFKHSLKTGPRIFVLQTLFPFCYHPCCNSAWCVTACVITLLTVKNTGVKFTPSKENLRSLFLLTKNTINTLCKCEDWGGQIPSLTRCSSNKEAMQDEVPRPLARQ